MIYDKLDNLELYKGLSDDIYEGLQYLRTLDTSIAKGMYQINPRVKAIVSEYETMKENVNGFEAHNRFIDIQTTVRGVERVSCMPIEKLTVKQSYSLTKDAAFYYENSQSQDMIIGEGYFAIFFPQDGHMPQLCLNRPELVKKVVIKVEIV